MNHKEPLIRMVKRDGIRPWQNWLVRGIAIVTALILSGLFIFSVTGLNPVKVYGSMFQGALGTSRRTWVTIRDTMMLLCIAVGLAPAFKMRFWNIGAEGQILVGGVATAGLMITLGRTGMSTPLMLLIMCVASIIAGALWGVIPAVFKARWGTNETLFTLMMNYVAIQITSYCVSLWENPYGSNTVGIINSKTKAGWFPALLEKGQEGGLTAFLQKINANWLLDILQNSVLLNVLLVMLLTVGMYLYLKYSKQGYEISVLGESERTARYAGIKPARVFIRTMAISGAICGLAGFIAVSGASHTISTSTAGGRGFTAIIVAWLAKFNTFVMLLIALLLVFLEKGAIQIASDFQLNDFASKVVTGIVLFCIIASEFFINYRLVFRTRKGAEA